MSTGSRSSGDGTYLSQVDSFINVSEDQAPFRHESIGAIHCDRKSRRPVRPRKTPSLDMPVGGLALCLACFLVLRGQKHCN
ncbi:hypothetical protein SCHPADRAFT_484965 [Schizopora paradoxa]|uniref:Uncharacterized protein n=1 Tax=Schizopora paradoxa TaxID=27342 RepID=A0A0H2RHT3_9AGAM|nr:hypothetical protein SCHPADRAFT_484965 [Schizopora paradoxa]